MENAEYDSSRPLAEQVAQKIKDYILEEKLKAGDKLPTETALAKEMGVARSTVREAIKRLESQNILTVRHGAGSFVTDQPGLADDPLGLDFIEDKERLAFDLLANLDAKLGDLNRIKRCVKVLGFVNCTDDFTQQPQVINGGSNLLFELFGEEKGLPARTAMGTNSCPGNIAVEIEMLVEYE